MFTRAQLSVVAVILAFATSSAVPACADTVLFAQRLFEYGGVPSEVSNVNGLIDQEREVDNFVLPSDSTITSIDWGGDRSPTSTISSFTFTFYNTIQSGAGMPLYSLTVDGNGSEVPYARRYIVNKYFTSAVYTDRVNFAVTGGTEYWLSIVANDNEFRSWFWGTSDPGDGSQNTLYRGETYPYNEAFTLLGQVNQTSPPPPSPVPEPSSLALTGSGILTLAGMLRRRVTNRALTVQERERSRGLR